MGSESELRLSQFLGQNRTISTRAQSRHLDLPPAIAAAPFPQSSSQTTALGCGRQGCICSARVRDKRPTRNGYLRMVGNCSARVMPNRMIVVKWPNQRQSVREAANRLSAIEELGRAFDLGAGPILWSGLSHSASGRCAICARGLAGPAEVIRRGCLCASSCVSPVSKSDQYCAVKQELEPEEGDVRESSPGHHLQPSGRSAPASPPRDTSPASGAGAGSAGPAG